MFAHAQREWDLNVKRPESASEMRPSLTLRPRPVCQPARHPKVLRQVNAHSCLQGRGRQVWGASAGCVLKAGHSGSGGGGTHSESLSLHLSLPLFHSGGVEVGSVLSLPLPPSRPAACFKCLSSSSAGASQRRRRRKQPLSAGHLSCLKPHTHPPFLPSPPYSRAAC